MTPAQGGSWFLLVVNRPDKKFVILDSVELSAIPGATLAALMAQMGLAGITVVLNEVGDWKALDFHEDLYPSTAPPCIEELAKYVPDGTELTLDNGCFPSIYWHFDRGTVEVFDDYDRLPAET